MINHRDASREVQLLRHILDRYMQDLRDTGNEQHQFVYFIDAHDVRAFIHGSPTDMLVGFALKAEEELDESDDPGALESDVRFKSERVLQWLLFEQPLPVILLQPHADELNEEIAHLHREHVARTARLTEQARAQIRRLRERYLGTAYLNSLIKQAEKGDERCKERILEFLTTAAPAALLLLKPNPDERRKRLSMLFSRSRLVLLENVRWEDYGFDAHLCTLIRSLRPQREVALDWTHRLSTDRQNTNVSNRRDALAIAYVSALNTLFTRFSPQTHAALVTRARTIVNALRDPGVAENLTDIVRHSRMIVLPAHDSSPPPAIAAEPGNGSAAMTSLSLALDTYERQLDSRPVTLAVSKEELKGLVSAWNQFEDGIFTIDLAQTTTAASTTQPTQTYTDNEYLELMQWLKNEGDVETLVMKHLGKDIESFESSFFATHAESLPAFTWRGREGRIRVQPLALTQFGPVDLDPRLFSKVDLTRQPIDLREILMVPSDNAAENYLVRSLAQCMDPESKLAEIYADHAARRAALFDRQQTHDEAVLLLAQLTRLKVSRKPGDESRDLERLIKALRDCASWHSDPRFGGEWARLLLENALHRGHDRATLESLYAACMERLDTAYVQSERDPVVSTRIAEAMLLLLLAIGSADRAGPDTRSYRSEMLTWRARLLAQLSEVRRIMSGDDCLSLLTRALETLSDELVRETGPDSDQATDTAQIPGSARSFAGDLQVRLAARSDQTAHIVARKLASVMGRMGGYNLVYAPIWDPAQVDAALADIADPHVRLAAVKANRIVHEVGDRQLLFKADEQEAERLGEALKLYESVVDKLDEVPDYTRYHVHMQYCYGLLLASKAQRDASLRHKQLCDLLSRYDSLLRTYSTYVVLHYRRGIVLSELKRDEDALAAMLTARDTVPSDLSIGHTHWIASTIRRRIGVHFAVEAEKDKQALSSRPDDEALRTQYMNKLSEAFKSVYEGFDDSAEPRAYRAVLETKRRLNNIVYYASLYVRAGGRPESLARNFSRKKLARFTAKLLGEDIQMVSEWEYLHTAGSVYHALGMARESRHASERLWALLSSGTANISAEDARDALADALEWKQKGFAHAAMSKEHVPRTDSAPAVGGLTRA
ncbi:hypothetical protein BYI23_C000460 [Burkholderia sp. YI23]|nr:hypothetical protein BYI23_C000460 [Burkholderia sp. YI23]